MSNNVLVTNFTCIKKKKKSLLITTINNNLGGSVAEGADEPRCHFQHFQTSQKTPNEQKLEYSKK